MYFYGLWGRQAQGPPRAPHTLATPLPVLYANASLTTFFSTKLSFHIPFSSASRVDHRRDCNEHKQLQ